MQLGAAAIGAYAAAVMVIQAALRIPKHIAYTMVAGNYQSSDAWRK
jgi:hypothetical protein